MLINVVNRPRITDMRHILIPKIRVRYHRVLRGRYADRTLSAPFSERTDDDKARKYIELRAINDTGKVHHTTTTATLVDGGTLSKAINGRHILTRCNTANGSVYHSFALDMSITGRRPQLAFFRKQDNLANRLVGNFQKLAH